VTTMTEGAVGSVREFKMPDVGEGLTEAEILKWCVKPGDTVTDGQVVCEVETAKAAVELPIPYDGVVRDLRVPEGTTVDVGTVIITVDTGGGAAAEPARQTVEPEPEQPQGRQPVLVGYGVAASSTRRRPRKSPPETAPREPAAAIQAELNGSGRASATEPGRAGTTTPGQASVTDTGQASATDTGRAGTTAPSRPSAPGAAPGAGARPLAKPPVRKLAKDLGVDLAAVIPTGPDGVVTREDVHAAVATPATAAPEPSTGTPARTEPTAPPAAYDTARETRVPIKGVRKATAAAMVGSAFTAPHVTEFVTVDVTRTMKLVEELRQDREFEGLRVNPLLLISKALLVAIRRHPEINAAWDEAAQEIVVKHYVNLGIAAATPRGLIVPNIKDAHGKTLPELARSLGELVTTARDGKTSPAAMRGGTVTITNVGVFGIDTGTPILNPGESAILAVGAIKLQPWVHKGKVKPRQVTTLALSFDHRLVDGELGSKVLADVAAVLEQPKRLISWA
jgi:2-oxoisovalerate dehydrogenase E2 component (dihydrolipoyl transacylase)